MSNNCTEEKHILSIRSAGVLLHPTSLPCTESYWEDDTAHAFGTLGVEAYNFIDFMEASNLRVWQVLPLGPTQKNLSPYQCLSIHAGNPDLISLDNLNKRGWLNSFDLKLENKSLDGLKNLRKACAKRFYENIKQEQGAKAATVFKDFCQKHSYWLNDYALFSALHEHFNFASWVDWPEELRKREPKALDSIRQELEDEVNVHLFEQFAFAIQWQSLKEYASQKNVAIFGDMPIYVGHNSSEVWAQPQYFKLDDKGLPTFVAGVPPDSFSQTGQRWGNPVYAWDTMQDKGFDWWLSRFSSQMEYFDLIRIDHFRGFQAYWEIPANKPDARVGQWVEVPGDALLKACFETYPGLQLVAENLGLITEEVEDLREKFSLPGMHVLHFAFENRSDNSHLPHRHVAKNIVYTGTHDNNTTVGWLNDLNDDGRQQLANYTYNSQATMPWLLIDMALSSSCNLAIIPMQDFLGLDGQSRMNTPSTAENNWLWKFSWEQVDANLSQVICDRLKKYHRVTMHKNNC